MNLQIQLQRYNISIQKSVVLPYANKLLEELNYMKKNKMSRKKFKHEIKRPENCKKHKK